MSARVVPGVVTDPSVMQVVNAGTNLSTSRPLGAGTVYWQFDAGVDVGEKGANIVNRQDGDQYFVKDAP